MEIHAVHTLPAPGLPPGLAQKYERMLACLSGLESALIAFSGGIDSSLVAYLAHKALGPRALAVTSGSESLTRDDLELTRRLAGEWGLAHRVIQTREMDNPRYAANPVDRCYFCKTTLYEELTRMARSEGYAFVLNGTNADDLGGHRPGLKAAQEFGVRSPLAELGFSKEAIRELSRHLSLPNAEKPQAACLASRVPYGQPITLPVLGRIERAESVLKSLGFNQLRVRHHNTIARLEVPEADFPRVIAHRTAIDTALRDLGYTYVTLDLKGFRSGSLNEVLGTDP